jgi:hypothetical protein
VRSLDIFDICQASCIGEFRLALPIRLKTLGDEGGRGCKQASEDGYCNPGTAHALPHGTDTVMKTWVSRSSSSRHEALVALCCKDHPNAHSAYGSDRSFSKHRQTLAHPGDESHPGPSASILLAAVVTGVGQPTLSGRRSLGDRKRWLSMLASDQARRKTTAPGQSAPTRPAKKQQVWGSSLIASSV